MCNGPKVLQSHCNQANYTSYSWTKTITENNMFRKYITIKYVWYSSIFYWLSRSLVTYLYLLPNCLQQNQTTYNPYKYSAPYLWKTLTKSHFTYFLLRRHEALKTAQNELLCPPKMKNVKCTDHRKWMYKYGQPEFYLKKLRCQMCPLHEISQFEVQIHTKSSSC